LPPPLQGHSDRTWLFGRALAIVDGNEMDDELFYCGALLHDDGIVSPTAKRDFTLGSVDRMLACANVSGVDGNRADLLADGVCVHTTPGVKVETDGTIGCYLQWGAMVDGAGLRIWDIAPDNVKEVLRRYPRGDFKRELIGMMRAEAAAVPDGRFGLLVRCGFAVSRAVGSVRFLTCPGSLRRDGGKPLIKGCVEVTDRAFVSSELHEFVCARP
jgi:hypothetical protein